MATCTTCRGAGTILHTHVNRDGTVTKTWKTCPRCHGNGEEPGA